MRNKNTHSITLKKKLNKCAAVFNAYHELQYEYGERLDADPEIVEIKCNVPIEPPELEGAFTTDFYCVKKDGTVCVRECVYREKLLRPKTIQMLDACRSYWLSKGIRDWGIVLNASQ